MTVLGLVPHSLDMSLDLSEEIRDRLPLLVEAAVKELAALGLRLGPRH